MSETPTLLLLLGMPLSFFLSEVAHCLKKWSLHRSQSLGDKNIKARDCRDLHEVRQLGGDRAGAVGDKAEAQALTPWSSKPLSMAVCL